MSQVEHWKKLKDTNFLGSWDLLQNADKNGKPVYGEIIAVIDYTRQEEVIDVQTNGKKKVPVCHFQGGAKPMILNSTNMKAITKVTGTPLVNFWAGKQVTIYVDKVKAFGDTHDALRIRPFAPVPPKTYKCTDCGCEVAENMKVRTEKAFGVCLCATCGKKRAEPTPEPNQEQTVDDAHIPS